MPVPERLHPLTAASRSAVLPCLRWALIAAVLSASACKDSTPPLVPTAILTTTGSISLDAVGATQAVAVTVNDQNGHAMTGVAISWTSAPATVATVSGGTSATVVATGNGSGAVVAHAGNAQLSIPVTVLQVPVAPVKVTGDAQTAVVGSTLTTALRVRVQDRLGNAMTGTTVTFTPGPANGTAFPATVVTGADGSAETTWTLGRTPGAQTLDAAAAGATAASTFTATVNVGPPASVAVLAGNNQTATAGTPVAIAPAVRVTDTFSNLIPGASVTFAATAANGTVTGGTTTTNSSGVATVGSWTLGTVAGAKTLTATVGGVAPAVISATAVAGPPASVAITTGNSQTAVVSTPVGTLPAVRVTDANGNNVGGVAVTFAVATGGGTATGTAASTSAAGTASVGSWTLGATPGTNTLTATVAGTGIAGNPATFTASGISVGGGGGGGGGSTNMRIELRYLTTGSPAQTAAFDAAAARWQSIITGKLTDTPLNITAGQCGSNAPAMNETIDDLVIFVTLTAIDGPGNILGSAGPCFIRNSNGLPLLGQMRFDTADLATMEANGTLNSVILHEMGHVLGIGSLWNQPPYFSLLANPSLPSSAGVDTRFTGPNGIAGFDLIGGATYTGGGKVPVENTQGGNGTRDSHWRETVLQNELMTGFISSSGTNPLSVMTLRSLQDFGYSVNTALADQFFLSLGAAVLQAPQGIRVPLGDDVIRVPIVAVDDRGQAVRVLRPNRP